MNTLVLVVTNAPALVVWPLCGCDNDDGTACNSPAVWIGISGVGFCHTHEEEEGPDPVKAQSTDDFNAWWCAASIAAANKDESWTALSYGEWPS